MHLLGEQINKLKFNGKAIAHVNTAAYPVNLPDITSDSGLSFNGNLLCALRYDGNTVYQQHIQKDRYEKEYGICCRGNCEHYITKHEHITPSNQTNCKYCGTSTVFNSTGSYYVTTTFKNENHKSNVILKNSPRISKLYKSKLPSYSYHIDCVKDIDIITPSGLYMKYDEIEAGTGYMPYPHVYCHDNSDQYCLYGITVSTGGIYTLDMHLRAKDLKVRGAKITINPSVHYYSRQYGIALNYNYTNSSNVKIGDFYNNDLLRGVYLGRDSLDIELEEGYNEIKIERLPGTEKNLHFRDLYLTYKEPSCYHSLNSSNVCTKCGRVFNLSMDEAEEIGFSVAPGIQLYDSYYVTVNFNNGDPRASDGFCRVITSNSHLMSISRMNTLGIFDMPVEGVTANLRCKVGCVTSVVNSDYNREARLFDATILGFETKEIAFIRPTTGANILAPYRSINIRGHFGSGQYGDTTYPENSPGKDFNEENIEIDSKSFIRLSVHTGAPVLQAGGISSYRHTLNLEYTLRRSKKNKGIMLFFDNVRICFYRRFKLLCWKCLQTCYGSRKMFSYS